jgi:hypothetical protein
MIYEQILKFCNFLLLFVGIAFTNRMGFSIIFVVFPKVLRKQHLFSLYQKAAGSHGTCEPCGPAGKGALPAAVPACKAGPP